MSPDREISEPDDVQVQVAIAERTGYRRLHSNPQQPLSKQLWRVPAGAGWRTPADDDYALLCTLPKYLEERDAIMAALGSLPKEEALAVVREVCRSIPTIRMNRIGYVRLWLDDLGLLLQTPARTLARAFYKVACHQSVIDQTQNHQT